jgi:hypothetical protein
MILFILSIKTADFKLCASMTEEIVKLKIIVKNCAVFQNPVLQ